MSGEAGVSAFERHAGRARLIATDGQALRAMAIRPITLLRAAPMPRVWNSEGDAS